MNKNLGKVNLWPITLPIITFGVGVVVGLLIKR